MSNVPTIKAICDKHNITPAMFDKATHITVNETRHLYIVEDISDPAIEHRVEWDATLKVVYCSCEEHFGCWHTRAALAAEEHYKAEQLARRQAEQAQIEATPEYQLDQLFYELETALDALDTIAQESKRREARHAAVLETIAKAHEALSA